MSPRYPTSTYADISGRVSKHTRVSRSVLLVVPFKLHSRGISHGQSPKARATQVDSQLESDSMSGDNEKSTSDGVAACAGYMLKAIDNAVKARPYKIPRHSWLLEAVHEKLARLRNIDTTRSG